MKIILIETPSPFLMDEKVNTPLGLLYLSAFLKQDGYDVVVRHLTGDNYEEFNEQADIYGLSLTTPQYPYAIKIATRLKELYPKSVLVAGGVHPTVRPQECLDYFDYVVKGEGEHALSYLVRQIELGRKPYSRIIEGMYVKDMATLPMPDFNAVDLKSYKYYVGDRLATSIMSSRGCAWDCAFCNSCSMWKGKIRRNSVENVIKEIDLLYDMGYRAVVFQDDVFTLDQDRVKRIGEHLLKKGMIYRCLIRGDDTTTLEKLKIMKDTGCVHVGFGCESGSQKMLDMVNKRTSVEKNMEIIQRCKDAGLIIKTFFIIGLPGESHETIAETMKWIERAKSIGMDGLDANIFYPYPGTTIRENMDKYDIKLRDTSYDDSYMKGRSGEYRAMVSTSHLTAEEIVMYRDKIFNDFYSK